MPWLSVLLSAVDRRTQAALPCPCKCSRFKESGATPYHCAVLQEVWLTAYSQHSLGFLCQVTTSCVYFLCFLSSSLHRYFLNIHQELKKRKDGTVFISADVYLCCHEGLCLVWLANWHCFQFASVLPVSRKDFFFTQTKKDLNQF